MPRVRVYMAISLSGHVAGPDHDVSWLDDFHPEPGTPTGALGFEDFLAQCGSMLMGRATHDTVLGFGVWPYGDLPVFVATRRPLQPASDTVTAVQGPIDALLATAKAAAGERDVYLDGGDLVQQALVADLVDELCLTVVPTVLPGGVRLFAELEDRTDWHFGMPQAYGPMVQLTAVRRR